METGLENIAGMFEANTGIVNKAIADIATEDWFRNPGADSNHLMWVMGHFVGATFCAWRSARRRQ